MCDGVLDCYNTDRDEESCPRETRVTRFCDHVCDKSNCADEADCNGVKYGVTCNITSRGKENLTVFESL